MKRYGGANASSLHGSSPWGQSWYVTRKIKIEFVLTVYFNHRFWTWINGLPQQGLTSLTSLGTSLTSLASRLYKQLLNQQHAEFLAFLCDAAIDVPSSDFGLILCCCPRYLKEEMTNRCSKYKVLRQGEGNSEQPLYYGERIFVNLHLPLSHSRSGILSEEQLRNYHLQ